MRAVEPIAEQAATHGVSRAFGIPGGGPSLDLIDALEKRGVEFITTHFEGAAVMMAGATGRLTGTAGMAVSIKGPGLSNMVPGLAACLLDTMPVVAVAEAYPPGTPQSRAHKRLDHEALASGATKGRRFVSESGPDFGQMAAWAEAETPGPVLLDIAAKPLAEDKPVPGEVSPPRGDIAGRISKAQRPLVIAGTFAARNGCGPLLSKLNVPVFSTAAAKGVTDENLANSAGVYTGVGLELAPEATLLAAADLIVGIGLRSNEVLAAGNLPCAAVNMDPLGGSASPGFDFAELGVDGIEALAGKDWGLDVVAECRSRLRTRLLSGPFQPAHVFEGFRRRFGTGARMVLDTGNFCTVGEHIWSCARPDLYLASGQGRYMGTAVPMAIAAALQDRTVPTITAVGDGGVGMFFAEMKLAAVHRLPLVVAFMSDGGFGSILGRARQLGLSEKSLTMARPTFAAAAEGLGLRAECVADETALQKVLESWSLEDGPLFVEATFDAEAALGMVEGVR